jgi:hypothetical protein
MEPRASDRRVCIRILKRLQGFSAMTETYHKAHPLDRAAMVAMRGTITAHLGPNSRPAFDELRGRNPSDQTSMASADSRAA